MRRVAVGFGVSSDGAQPKGPASALDPKGDLAAIGDQDGAKHRRSPDPQERLAGVHLVARLDKHGFDNSGAFGADLYKNFHRFDEANGGVHLDERAGGCKRGSAGRRRQVDDPAERGVDVGGDGIIDRLALRRGWRGGQHLRRAPGVLHSRRAKGFVADESKRPPVTLSMELGEVGSRHGADQHFNVVGFHCVTYIRRPPVIRVEQTVTSAFAARQDRFSLLR